MTMSATHSGRRRMSIEEDQEIVEVEVLPIEIKKVLDLATSTV